jgi:hypothetical protein
MSIKRSIIIPAILTLSATGSILAGSAAPMIAAQAPAAQTLAASSSAGNPLYYYHT